MPPSSAKNPSPSMGKTTRTLLPGKLEAANSAARLMLVAFTGTVKAPPSPLTSTDRFTKVVRESSTMSRMVEDLLFLARTESAATPFRMEPVEAQVLLAGLERRAGALAAEHDATLDTTLLATGLVRVDPVRLGTGDPGPRGQRGKVRPGGTARNPRVPAPKGSCASTSVLEVQAYRKQNSHTSSSVSTGWPVPRSQAAASASR